MTLEEEGKLLKYYAGALQPSRHNRSSINPQFNCITCAGKIQELCRAFGFPQKVAATGVSYLHRAYTTFSSLDHDPKDIMLACIYLAGKARCVLPRSNTHQGCLACCCLHACLWRTQDSIKSTMFG